MAGIGRFLRPFESVAAVSVIAWMTSGVMPPLARFELPSAPSAERFTPPSGAEASAARASSRSFCRRAMTRHAASYWYRAVASSCEGKSGRERPAVRSLLETWVLLPVSARQQGSRRRGGSAAAHLVAGVERLSQLVCLEHKGVPLLRIQIENGLTSGALQRRGHRLKQHFGNVCCLCNVRLRPGHKAEEMKRKAHVVEEAEESRNAGRATGAWLDRLREWACSASGALESCYFYRGVPASLEALAAASSRAHIALSRPFARASAAGQWRAVGFPSSPYLSSLAGDHRAKEAVLSPGTRPSPVGARTD